MTDSNQAGSHEVVALSSELQVESVAAGRNFELVLRQLQGAIERGGLKPGVKLPSEPELAARFGVSRTALREALKILELSGYLEVRRGFGGGTFVSQPKPEEFAVISPPPLPTLSVSPLQLMEVRLAIEPAAARLAAAQEPEVVASLYQAIHQAMEDMKAFDDRPAHVLSAVVDFHVAVARAGGNPVFVTVVESLRPVMAMGMNKLVQSRGWRDTCRREHQRIAAAIRRRDSVRAEQLMRRHVWDESEIDASGQTET